jgi:hypothetical protein
MGLGASAREVLAPPYEAPGGAGVAKAVVLLPLGERAGRVVVTDAGEVHQAANRTEAIPPPEATAGVDVLPGDELLPEDENLPGAGVVWRMSVGGWWVVDVVADAGGGVLILSEVEEAEARRVVYDPPMPMLPAELWMGRPIEFTSNVGVYNHETGVLESTGTCTATYRLLGKKTLSPGGLLPGDAPAEVAYIVRVDRQYKLPLVVVDMKIITAYAPGQGPIAAKTVRIVRLLGLIPVVHKQSVVRR